MKEWTFVTSYALVLGCIAEQGRVTAREIGQTLGITERRVVKIISDLEAAGYVSKRRAGNHNIYSVNTKMPLRHPTQRDKSVEKLLALLTPFCPKVSPADRVLTSTS